MNTPKFKNSTEVCKELDPFELMALEIQKEIDAEILESLMKLIADDGDNQES